MASLMSRCLSAHDDLEYTVMSYRSYVGGPLTGYTNEAYGYSQTYMANDILALQTLYGANFTTHSENTVYSWSATTGQEFINGVAQPAPGGGAGGSANRVFETVWDGNGIDTYDMSNYTTAVSINLNPGASSITSTDAVLPILEMATTPREMSTTPICTITMRDPISTMPSAALATTR